MPVPGQRFLPTVARERGRASWRWHHSLPRWDRVIVPVGCERVSTLWYTVFADLTPHFSPSDRLTLSDLPSSWSCADSSWSRSMSLTFAASVSTASPAAVELLLAEVVRVRLARSLAATSSWNEDSVGRELVSALGNGWPIARLSNRVAILAKVLRGCQAESSRTFWHALSSSNPTCHRTAGSDGKPAITMRTYRNDQKICPPRSAALGRVSVRPCSVRSRLPFVRARDVVVPAKRACFPFSCYTVAQRDRRNGCRCCRYCCFSRQNRGARHLCFSLLR